MFKLVVLFACVVAVTVAEPGYIGDSYGLGHGYGYGGLGYGYGHGGYAAIPAAVSHQSQVSIHSKPIITAVATPVVTVAKPVHYVAALPSATSHQSRVDYVSKPIVSYAAPALSYGSSYVASTPVVSGLYGSGYQGLGGYGLGYGSGLGYEHGLSYGHGYGNGYGHGYGSGYGHGYGSGYGHGYY